MSSIKKGFQNYSFESEKKESFIGISDSIISFLSLSNKETNKDIYSDTKNVRFNELNPEFKQILKQEFLDAILSLKNDLLQKKGNLKTF